MKRNQTILELEKLKILLTGPDEQTSEKKQWKLAVRNADSNTQLLQRGNPRPNQTVGVTLPDPPCDIHQLVLDDGATKLPGLRPDSPSSDVFSDASSGLGTMPSPVSDLDSAPELLPSRPATQSSSLSENGSEPENVIEEEAMTPAKDVSRLQKLIGGG